MRDIVLLAIFAMAVGVCWPVKPMLLLPEPRRFSWPRRQLTLEETTTIEWAGRMLEEARVRPHEPGRHRAEAQIGGRSIFGRPRARTAPLTTFGYDPFDSTAAHRLRDILDRQHTAAETSLDLPEWARDPEQQR